MLPHPLDSLVNPELFLHYSRFDPREGMSALQRDLHSRNQAAELSIPFQFLVVYFNVILLCGLLGDSAKIKMYQQRRKEKERIEY